MRLRVPSAECGVPECGVRSAGVPLKKAVLVLVVDLHRAATSLVVDLQYSIGSILTIQH